MKIFISLFCFALALLPGSLKAESATPSDAEILQVINGPSKDSPLYEEANLGPESRKILDLNGDGVSEFVVIPISACGDTHNCAFFLLQKDKKKGWRLILNADGKVTSLTPTGFVASPRKTQGWPDLIAVFDRGPEPNGSRYLDRRVYVWNGTSYNLFSDTYPPDNNSPELQALLKKVEQLKFEKGRYRSTFTR